jgi:hypothetical protein
LMPAKRRASRRAARRERSDGRTTVEFIRGQENVRGVTKALLADYTLTKAPRNALTGVWIMGSIRSLAAFALFLSV